MGRWIRRTALLTLLLVLIVVGGGWFALRASLPQHDGEGALAGLTAPVTVERDDLGTATIRAGTRADAMRALGWVHAQERWFEMDLARRSAAGELAALLGPALLDADRRIRGHRLRARAEAAVARLPAGQRALLDAYVDGANAGLAALGARPWQYLLLRQQPQPWTAADSVLVVHAMFITLTGPANTRELAFDAIRRHAPPALAALFDPGLGDTSAAHAGSPWDAPLDGQALPVPRLPRADEVDLRTLDPALFGREHAIGGDLVSGSNAFAVAGTRTPHGAAIVQNDMHLGLGVPNIWFRARLEYADERVPTGRVAVTGVSLPGVPGIVVGSNGRVAWGFTNSYVDASDWVVVRWADAARTRYCVAQAAIDGADAPAPQCTETAAVAVHREAIAVAGGTAHELEVRETRWGPILARDDAGNDLAASWIAHHPEAVDLGLADMDAVGDVAAAISLTQGIGMPPQNLVAADAAGSIGWTVTGRLPRRSGFFARAPADWSIAPGIGWDGWLEGDERPQRVDPPDGAIWTANARLVGGAELARLGDGGYALGARAAQIRDGLAARARLDETAMLEVALDDRAIFLARWRERLLAVLAREPDRAGFRELEAQVRAWGGRAAPESVGYRAVRAWRDRVIERLVDGLTAPVRAHVPDFKTPRLEQIEGVAWRLLDERPPHLLAPTWPDYDALESAVAAEIADAWLAQPGGIAARTWGERNTSRIQHPLARALPVLSPLLDMQREPLPGDAFMPRVQAPAFGASQRMAVAPGREADGHFHMPGGQSGHPLSPYYASGHGDWASGRATPFLPGDERVSLTLLPSSAR